MACKNKQEEESDFLIGFIVHFTLMYVAKDFFKNQEKCCRANCLELPTIYFYKFGIPCG